MNRLSVIIIAVLSFLSSLSQRVSYDGITYEIISGSSSPTCAVTYQTSNLYSGNITVPSTIEAEGIMYEVVEIGDYAFSGCGNLTSVSLPSSVSRIGRNAFYECKTLQKVSGAKINFVGKGAFSGCSSLSSLGSFVNLERIEDSAFKDCVKLISVELGSIKELGVSVFDGCSGLAEIKLPQNLKVIPDYTFNGCSSLKTVILGSGVERIGDYAFYNCSGLSSIKFPDSLSEIGRAAFYLCKSLNLAHITGQSLYISDYAFYGCLSIKDLKFDNVEEIGEEAFADCSSLETIFFEQPVKYIRERAFRNADSIIKVSCSSRQPAFLAANSFDEDVYKKAVLVVPTGSRLLYMQSYPWSNFVDVEGSETVEVEAISGDENCFNVLQSGDRLIVKGGPGYLTISNVDGKVIVATRKRTEDFEISKLKRGLYVVSLGNDSLKFLVR